MQEKTMVSDALSGINASLESMGYMISQTANQQLRQTLIQMRNSSETSQYELYELAKNHGYYEPAAEAKEEEIKQVRSIFSKTSLL